MDSMNTKEILSLAKSALGHTVEITTRQDLLGAEIPIRLMVTNKVIVTGIDGRFIVCQGHHGDTPDYIAAGTIALIRILN